MVKQITLEGQLEMNLFAQKNKEKDRNITFSLLCTFLAVLFQNKPKMSPRNNFQGSFSRIALIITLKYCRRCKLLPMCTQSDSYNTNGFLPQKFMHRNQFFKQASNVKVSSNSEAK